MTASLSRIEPAAAPPVASCAGDAPDLNALFETMTLIRTVERSLLDLFATGKLRGTVHTCLGQEAIAAGVISALDTDRDSVCSNHRGHGHFLAYTGDSHGLIAEIMGLPSGVCGGLGGSQHLQSGNFYSNGILGGMSPVATGIAMAEAEKGTGGICTVFHGDGAMAEGAIYEAMNIAALWKLPVLWVIEANQWAQSTPIEIEQAGDLARRAEHFGVGVDIVDGNDVGAVAAASAAAVRSLRAGNGPRLLFLETYRLGPHSKGDDDRDPAEIERHWANDPIARTAGDLDAGRCQEIETRISAKIEKIVEGLVAE